MPNMLSGPKQELLYKLLHGELADNTRQVFPKVADDAIPLSFAQETMWRATQAAGSLAYNETITVKREGSLDMDVLDRSLSEIISRHEIWRTTYENDSGTLRQRIHPPPSTCSLQLTDLRSFPEADRNFTLRSLASTQACEPFDLVRGPLLRAQVVRMSEEDWRLVLTAHLSIVDGVSVYQILPSELAAIYSAFAAGKSSPLSALQMQFRDFANLQRRLVRSAGFTNDLEYWHRELNGNLNPPAWPPNQLRPALQTFHGAIRSFDLSERLTDAVRQLSKKEEVTLFNILLVGFSVLLHCYTEQSDIVIGTLSSSRRKRIEFQGLLGHFLNPIALRIKLSSDSSFSALIRQSHKAIAKAMTHDEVPIEILADSLMAAQDANRNSLFNVAISLQPKTPSLDGWTVTSMDGDSGGSIWAFYLAFIEQSKKLSCRVQYDPELIEGPAIAQLEKHLDILLSKATQDPNRRLSDFRGLLPTYA